MQSTDGKKGYPFIRSGGVNKPAGIRTINDSFQPFHAAIETGRNRLLIAATVISLTFAAIGSKLVELSILGNAGKVASKNGIHVTKHQARSDILDRSGNVLATDLTMASLYADPFNIIEPAKAAAAITRTLPDLDSNKVLSLLKRKRRFVWIKRHLSPRQQQAIHQLGIPGLEFRREYRRVYPQGTLMAHALGYVDIDNNGIAGIEKSFNTRLQKEKRPVRLSLDVRVQHKLRTELLTSMARYQATGAAGLVLDVTNGEIISMVSLPDFDPNIPGKVVDGRHFNKASLGVYELGSAFKILTSAIAFNEGIITFRDGYDTSKPIRISGFTIRDHYGKNRWLSVPEIFIYSSNIGAGRMALDIGAQTQKLYFGRLGLLEPADTELPEIGLPIIPTNWSRTQAITIGFGHGISVSPLQLSSAVAASVNGGVFFQPTFIKRSEKNLSDSGLRVFTEATSSKIRRLLRLSVLDGTGKNADAKGYLVGGKTGTAEKKTGDGYDKDMLISSFVGVFPMTKPRYAIFAMLDEPIGTRETFGRATGGWVAAPIVKRVVEQIAPILSIAPLNEDSQQIRRTLAIDEYQSKLEARTLASFKAH